MVAMNPGCWPRTVNAWSRLSRKNATSMVGKDTSKDKLPAQFHVHAVEHGDSGNQQFASGDSHDRGHNADAGPSDHADDGENHERQGDTRQDTDVLGCEDHGDADKQHSQDSIEVAVRILVA